MTIDLDALRLNLVRGMTPRAASVLIDRFGSPQAVLRAPAREFAHLPDVGPSLAARLSAPPGEGEARRELRRAGGLGITILDREAEGYPQRLLETRDPPLVLYVRGETGPLEHSIALVGARRASIYGRVHAERFGRELSRAGLAVVSGLARGIDAAAHRGALDGGGRTVAVLGSGLDRVYPAEHKPLATEISARGAVCSELPLGSRPLPYQFPRRNRIIAGMTRAVLVVEGKLRSGSLITARLAVDVGRDVFALPGRVDTELAAGPHSLIREGAILAESPEQVLLDLGYRALDAPDPPDLPEDPLQRRILDALDAVDPVGVDELLRRLGADAPAVLAALLGLELSGRVRALPGRRYIRAQ